MNALLAEAWVPADGALAAQAQLLVADAFDAATTDPATVDTSHELSLMDTGSAKSIITAAHMIRRFALTRTLLEHLEAGAGVAIHCRAGIGRSSCLAAAVLVLDGLEPDEARARITEARGLQVPDTPGQIAFISGLSG